MGPRPSGREGDPPARGGNVSGDEAALRAKIEQLEAALARAELERDRARSDLEAVAASANHDLREPLRNVISFSHLLARRISGEDEKATRYIDHIAAGCRRFDRLMDAIVRFLRAPRSELAAADQVDLRQVIGDALEDLEPEISRRGGSVDVQVEGDLAPSGSPAGLTAAIHELVRNSLLFQGEAPPVIQVRARPVPEGWQLTVEDNGRGIPTGEEDRIFEPMVRLNGRSVHDGGGFGLAMVRRIAEAHGGRAWAEGRPEGSAFHLVIGGATSPPPQPAR